MSAPPEPTFDSIFVNTIPDESWSPNYQSYNNGTVQRPMDAAYLANGGSFIPGGPNWNYDSTQNWSSSIDQIRIGIENTTGQDFRYNLTKMSTILNIVLPAFMNFNFIIMINGRPTGIVLGGQEIQVTGTTTMNNQLTVTYINSAGSTIHQTISTGSGETATQTAASIASFFTGSGIGSTAYITDVGVRSVTSAIWTTPDTGQTFIVLNSGGQGPQVLGTDAPHNPANILDGFHAFN
jgi:hypothetical protein